MARALPPVFRQEQLVSTQRELLGELGRLRREEEYLMLKVRQAREQVLYYEGLLNLLRRDLGKPQVFPTSSRRMG